MKKRNIVPIHGLNETARALVTRGDAFVLRADSDPTSPTGIVWLCYVKRGSVMLCALGLTAREALEHAVANEWMDVPDEPQPSDPAALIAWIEDRVARGKLTKEQAMEMLTSVSTEAEAG